MPELITIQEQFDIGYHLIAKGVEKANCGHLFTTSRYNLNTLLPSEKLKKEVEEICNFT
jgi:hypothetical protein